MPTILLRTVAVVAITLIAYPVLADETGLAAVHAMRREGGQLCFLDHYHYGSSAGAASERAAIVAADGLLGGGGEHGQRCLHQAQCGPSAC